MGFILTVTFLGITFEHMGQMSQNSPHSKSPPGQTVSPINLSFVILGNHSLLWLYLNPIMIANEAYLDGLGATVTLNYITLILSVQKSRIAYPKPTRENLMRVQICTL